MPSHFSGDPKMNRKVEFYFFKGLAVLSGLAFAILLYMVIWFLGEPSMYGEYAETKVLPLCILFGGIALLFEGISKRALNK